MTTEAAAEPLGLFPEPEHTVPRPPPREEDTRTRGQRMRDRHLALIARGFHPLGPPLHPDARRDGDRAEDGTPRCGSCAFRETLRHHDYSFPKCTAGAVIRKVSWPDGSVHAIPEYPRVTAGPGSDVAAWWPACRDYYRPGTVSPPE
jgi:hypothetical protein